MDIVYRRAKRDDWEEIRALIAKFPQELMQSPLPRCSDFFVAELEGHLIGCAALDVHSKKLAEVRSVAVLTEYRRLRVASKLSMLCEERARGKKIHETVTFANLRAMKMFRRLGFRTFHGGKYALFKITDS